MFEDITKRRDEHATVEKFRAIAVSGKAKRVDNGRERLITITFDRYIPSQSGTFYAPNPLASVCMALATALVQNGYGPAEDVKIVGIR